MDFKKELIFAFIRKLGATIVNVDHTISKTCTEIQLSIKLDMTCSQKDTIQRSTLRSKLQLINKKGLELVAINISGSLIIWDLLVVCRKVMGHCNAMHVLMSPSAQISFTHGTDTRLSIETALNHMSGTMDSLSKVKDNLMGIAGSQHQGYTVQGPTLYANGSGTISPHESSGNPITINLTINETEEDAGSSETVYSQQQSAIQEVMAKMADTVQHASGVQYLAASVCARTAMDIALLCTGGSPDFQDITTEVREKIKELSKAIEKFDNSLNKLSPPTKQRRRPQPRTKQTSLLNSSQTQTKQGATPRRTIRQTVAMEAERQRMAAGTETTAAEQSNRFICNIIQQQSKKVLKCAPMLNLTNIPEQQEPDPQPMDLPIPEYVSNTLDIEGPGTMSTVTIGFEERTELSIDIPSQPSIIQDLQRQDTTNGLLTIDDKEYKEQYLQLQRDIALWTKDTTGMPLLTQMSPITPDEDLDFSCPPIMMAPEWDSITWETPNLSMDDYYGITLNDVSMPVLSEQWIPTAAQPIITR
jgi:hypothetical protein